MATLPPFEPDALPRASADVTALAVGAAHDVRNLLFVVGTHTQRLLTALAEDSPLRAEVEAIRDAAERGSLLTRQVLLAGRRTDAGVRLTDVNAVVRGCLPLVERLCGPQIHLDVDLAHAVWPVALTPTQVEQVLLNFVTNARDAMNGRGRLRIATAVTGDEEVRLIVADTGCGMDPVVQGRMFDPYFTTRAIHGGTGVGLATVKGIVDRSGGSIAVESAIGRGTAITVTWPSPQRGRVQAPHAPLARKVTDRPRILVVDDEPGVRELLGQCLRTQGYDPAMAGSGGEALALWSETAFDLVVCDVSLPDARGPELCCRFRRDVPDVELIFISGAIDAAVHVAMAGLDAPVLTKPFSMRDFVAATTGALKQAPAA